MVEFLKAGGELVLPGLDDIPLQDLSNYVISIALNTTSFFLSLRIQFQFYKYKYPHTYCILYVNNDVEEYARNQLS